MMYNNIINYINKQKPISVGSANANPIEYRTALDDYTTKRDLIDFIDEFIVELEEIQKENDIFIISFLSDFDPQQEMKRINDIFTIIEERHIIYPRMYLYLHRDFSAIRDAALLVNKVDAAIDIFNDLEDRVDRMHIFKDEEHIEREDGLKTILDDTNPVIGTVGYSYSTDICEFLTIYDFKIDKIVEHDSIYQSRKRINDDYDRPYDSKCRILDLSKAMEFDGFTCIPPVSASKSCGYVISDVDILLNLLHLMEADNVTKFWSKEINDAVERNNDYTAAWGFFTIHVPDTFKIQIPEHIRESMFKYIKFLSDQCQKYTSKCMPELTHNKSKKYFGLSIFDEFMYEFNNEVRDLLYDVYQYNSLIAEYTSVLSKERFYKLLDMIDRSHGIIEHNHIIVKFMIYNKILCNQPHVCPSVDVVPKLLTLFELLLDYDNYIGSELLSDSDDYTVSEEIDSIINRIQYRYKTLLEDKEKDRNIKEKIRYERKLFCMIFNCLDVDDIIENLKSKL